MIVTIDGPAGAGKSTVARELAQRLSIRYLDTGAMFRAYTLYALQEKLDLSDEQALAQSIDAARLDMKADARVFLNDADVSQDIRTPEVTAAIRHLANSAPVRAKLLTEQRKLAEDWGALVCDGRDTGTVVFPDAECKFYLDASIQERARRRRKDLEAQGGEVPEQSTLEGLIADRDRSDSERDVAPLRKAEDAITLDTTDLSFEQVLEQMLAVVQKSQAQKL